MPATLYVADGDAATAPACKRCLISKIVPSGHRNIQAQGRVKCGKWQQGVLTKKKEFYTMCHIVECNAENVTSKTISVSSTGEKG